MSLSRVTFKLYQALFAPQHWFTFWMLGSSTMAVGCFSDVIWYELNVSPERGRGNSYFRGIMGNDVYNLPDYLSPRHRRAKYVTDSAPVTYSGGIG